MPSPRTGIIHTLSSRRKFKATVDGLAAALTASHEQQVAVGWNYGTKVCAREKLVLFEPEVLFSSLLRARGL